MHKTATSVQDRQLLGVCVFMHVMYICVHMVLKRASAFTRVATSYARTTSLQNIHFSRQFQDTVGQYNISATGIQHTYNTNWYISMQPKLNFGSLCGECLLSFGVLLVSSREVLEAACGVEPACMYVCVCICMYKHSHSF
jgi:hypothetical protein